MGEFNAVEVKFKDLGQIRGGILFLPAGGAVKMVNEAEKEKLGIVGIDAFLLEDNKTEPSMENSIEFNFDANTDYDKVKKFLYEKRGNQKLWFEVVFEKGEEDTPI